MKDQDLFWGPYRDSIELLGDAGPYDALPSPKKIKGQVRLEGSKLGFPPALKDKFKNPQYLYTGSVFELWSVEYRGKKMAVKIFHVKEEAYMTWNRALVASHLMLKLVGAQLEFENSKDMRHGMLFDDTGSKYIMDVYESNFADALPDEPLFMVLEHCGDENLQQFQQRHTEAGTWTPDLVVDIYVQLLEALAYLGRHPSHWVHHNLKPGNIMIKTLPGGQMEVRLVDLKSAVVFDDDDDDRDDGHTGWRPQSYDIAASAAVLVELIMGVSLGHTLVHLGVQPHHLFQEFGVALKDTISFILDVREAREYTATATPFKADTLYRKVLTKAVDSLSNDASRRPTAEALLAFIKETLNGA